MDAEDKFFYCGTTTGDVLVVSIASMKYDGCGPQLKKNLFNCGIISLALNAQGNLIAGSGDGTVGIMTPLLKRYGSVAALAWWFLSFSIGV